MKISMKVILRDEERITDLVKQMCEWSAQVNMDLMNGEIQIDGAARGERNNIIDAVSKAFMIVGLETEFSKEETSFEETCPEQTCECNVERVPAEDAEKKAEDAPAEETTEAEEAANEEPTQNTEMSEGTESQEDEDGGYMFSYEVYRNIRHFMGILRFNLTEKGAPEEDIIKYIKSVGTEVGMKYNPRQIPNFEVGDIVRCNFGHHLDGELYGGYVFGIVCDISETTFYIVPVTKVDYEASSKYLPFVAGVDVDYGDPALLGGTALLQMGGTYNKQRVNAVVGRTRAPFFEKLLEALPGGVTFVRPTNPQEKVKAEEETDHTEEVVPEADADGETSQAEEVTEADDTETSQEEEAAPEAKPTKEGAAEESKDIDCEKNQEAEKEEPKKESVEEYITRKFNDVFSLIDSSAPIEEQVDAIVNSFGFDSTIDAVRYAFVVSTQTEKISYSNIQALIYQLLPDIDYDQILDTLKSEFKKWTAANPDIKERYPKIGMTTILKVFSKKFAGSEK